MNEKGFMYPLTLCVLLLFSIFITLQVEHYVIQAKFVNDVKFSEKKQYYFLLSLKKMEELLNEEAIVTTGYFYFKGGTVNYKVEGTQASILKVTFKFDFGMSKEVIGYGYYDKHLKKMIKWTD